MIAALLYAVVIAVAMVATYARFGLLGSFAAIFPLAFLGEFLFAGVA